MKKKLMFAVIAASLMSGCAATTGPSHKSESTAKPTLNDKVQLSAEKGENRAEPQSPYLFYAENPSIPYFTPIKASSRNGLPDVEVTSNVRLIDHDLNSIMTVLTDSVDMSFIIDQDVLQEGAVKSFMLRGSLPDLMEQIARAYDVVYDVNGRNIHIKKFTDFIVNLPPMNSRAKQVIASAIKEYGAKDVRFDDATTLHYVADRKTQEAIDGYLAMVKSTKSLITYDVYAWDVELPAGKTIPWDAYDRLVMSLKDATKSLVYKHNGGYSVMHTSCREGSGIDPTLVQSFLSSQGKVKLYKQPDLMLLSSTSEKLVFAKYLDNSRPETIVGKTVVNLAGDYVSGLVKTNVGVMLEAAKRNGKIIETTDSLRNRFSASVYPGGTILFTGIDAPNPDKGKRSEMAILLKPAVILLEPPAKGFFKHQEHLAEVACEAEKRERESSLTFRKMLLDQAGINKSSTRH